MDPQFLSEDTQVSEMRKCWEYSGKRVLEAEEAGGSSGVLGPRAELQGGDSCGHLATSGEPLMRRAG